MKNYKKLYVLGGAFVTIVFILLGGYAFYQNISCQVFGAEKVDYELLERTENRWVLTVAAKKEWIDNVSDFNIEFKEGYAEYDYVIEDADMSFWGYNVYNLVCSTYNYEFSQNGKVDIDTIEIISGDKPYVIHPSKISFKQYDWSQLNHDELYFSASPLKIPMDMYGFPIQLSVDGNDSVYIKEVVLTNGSITNYELEGKSGEVCKLLPGTLEEDFLINFRNSILQESLQYATDIVISYEVGGKQYSLVPEISTLYNPIDVTFLKKYYWSEIVF